MSRSPLSPQDADDENVYLDAWQQLALRIQQGASFSGREPNCCFLNTGSGWFADVSAVANLDQIDDSRTIAVTDWDQDGDLDVWQANRTGPRVRFLRNDLPAGPQFLALRLVGDVRQGCNRDAIGARAQLQLTLADGSKKTLVRTVQAGDGYLSQSSKWLHFGLPRGATVEALVIRWPAAGPAAVTTYRDLEANRRYRIEQQAVQAIPLPDRQPEVALDTQPVKPKELDDRVRLWLSQPQPLGTIAYRTLAGDPTSQHAPLARPMLLTLWASWCQPCLQELQELAQRQSEWQQQGVDVLALNVEMIDPASEMTLAQAADLLQQLQFPFPAGAAHQTLVERLQQIVQEAVYRQRPLALPSSFLIDEQGRVRCLYQGALDLSRVLQDAAALKQADAQTDPRDRAVPFAGRWAGELFVTNPIAIARVYREDGAPNDAQEYLQRYLQRVAEGAETVNAATLRRRLADVYHLLGVLALDQQQVDEAVAAFQQALQANPQHVAAHVDWAGLLLEQNQLAGAERHLRSALQQQPRNPDALNKLGLVYRRQKNTAQAVEFFRAALRVHSGWLPAANNLAWIRATHPDAQWRNGQEAVQLAERIVRRVGPRADILDTLAAAYAEAGRFEQAVLTARQAAERARRDGQVELAQQIESRLQQYESEQAFRDPIDRS